jgi:N-methylhydantoinase B
LYHLASFRPSLRELIIDFPLETMSPGDVFVFNDQFRGGIHANDILVFTPVFNSGEVVFFTCDLMHVADLGGVSAGGLPSNATEFYHEGLRLPPLRLYQAGQPNDDLVRIIKANSRTPDKVIGDIRAMVAGNHVGARRLAELIEKYGAERLLEICGELIDYTEVLTRREIAKIPSGVYEGSYLIEEDGVVPDKTYRVVSYDRWLRLSHRLHRYRSAGPRTDQCGHVADHVGSDLRAALFHGPVDSGQRGMLPAPARHPSRRHSR